MWKEFLRWVGFLNHPGQPGKDIFKGWVLGMGLYISGAIIAINNLEPRNMTGEAAGIGLVGLAMLRLGATIIQVRLNLPREIK